MAKSLQAEWDEATPDLSAEWESAAPAQAAKAAPSTASVALQSAAKGAARVPDMFLEIPADLFNLGSAGIGFAAGELGRPDITAQMPIAGPAFTQPVRAGLEAMGAISPEFEPQTAGQRIIGRALETAPSFAMAPGKTLANLATGAASGLVSGAVKEATGSELAAGAAGMLTPFAVRAAVSGGEVKNLTDTGRMTLKEAREVGYVVPPSRVKPTAITQKVESIGGKAAVQQEAAILNQQVTNRLAARAVGLPEETPLTPDVLKEVRKSAGAVYDRVEELRPNIKMEWFPRYHETDLPGQLRQARSEATRLWQQNSRAPMEETRKAAMQMNDLADSLEKDIHRIAVASGEPNLVKELAAARKLMAKTYDVERALMPDGNVNPQAVGTMLQKGKPLSAELRLIGKFAKTFPQASRWGASAQTPGVSATDALSSAALGTIGYGAAQGPVGLLAAGLPLLRGPARSAVLSGPMQNRLVAQPAPLGDVALQSLLAGRLAANQ